MQQVPFSFYNSAEWQQSIIDFYGQNSKYLPENIIEAPVKMLTGSIATAIMVYGVHPDMLIKCFELAINPLYDTGEYEKVNYKAAKDAAIENNDPRFNDLADALLNIRRLFEKTKGFLQANFAKEIAMVQGNTEEFKLTHFAEIISKITNIHVHQVAELIREACAVE